MERTFTETMTTGDIVTQFPMSSRIFKDYQISFCCSEDRPIGEAIKDKQLESEGILEQINELYVSAQNAKIKEDNWSQKNYSEFVDRIIEDHHTFLNEMLPELSGYVTKVYWGHGSAHPEVLEVYDLFHQLKTDLENHNMKKEETIFPQIKDFEKNNAASNLSEVIESLTELKAGYSTTIDTLNNLRELTGDYQAPEDACRTFQLAYLKLEELETDLFELIHLENNILLLRLNDEQPA